MNLVVGRLTIMEKFRGYIQVGFRYSRALGPRSEAAGVSLRLSTHDNYEFVSAARWPEDDYSGAVERGVREGLRESGYDPTWVSACSWRGWSMITSTPRSILSTWQLDMPRKHRAR